MTLGSPSQRRKSLRWVAVFRRLLVRVGVLNQCGFAKSSSQESKSCRQRVVRKSHGNGDSRKASLWREDLTVVARGTLHVANLARRIAPGRVNNSIHFGSLHGCEQRVAKGYLLLIVINIEAGRALLGLSFFRLDGRLQPAVDVRQKQA